MKPRVKLFNYHIIKINTVRIKKAALGIAGFRVGVGCKGSESVTPATISLRNTSIDDSDMAHARNVVMIPMCIQVSFQSSVFLLVPFPSAS